MLLLIFGGGGRLKVEVINGVLENQLALFLYLSDLVSHFEGRDKMTQQLKQSSANSEIHQASTHHFSISL